MRDTFIFALGLAVMGCGTDGGYEYAGETRAADGIGSPSGAGSTGSAGSGSADTLTAGAWDDNRNFEFFADYLLGADLLFTMEEHEAAQSLFGRDDREANAALDIALVVDTTGSMGDEIVYLQAELDAIATEVEAAYPAAETRWALIVYRDEGDEYVTRVFDFRGVDALRSDLGRQAAGGGGDYPEASDAALEDATNLAWREDAATARLAFWVADAPHHAERTGRLVEAVRTAALLDVHIYPVASSGVDETTERSMRSAAQVTGGRYLFLTDDSGVGGSHLEPTLPCYFVTLLSDAMLRMIDVEMSGVYREPTADQIIRTGGDPSDGACTLGSGEVVRIF